MALFRKKKQTPQPSDADKFDEFALPEPPELPEMQEFPDLPTEFAASTNIKRRFTFPETEEESQMPEPMQMPELPEMEEEEQEEFPEPAFHMPMPPKKIGMPSAFPKKFLTPLDFPEPESEFPSEFPIQRKRFMPIEKPIFVKLDKFRESIENLNEIKERLRNATSLLRKVREMRQREEQELAEWEHEIETLKSKLDGVEKKLFSDVE